MLTVQPGSGGSRSAAETAAQRKLLDSLAESFARSKRAVVLVGAGISTNAGIPVSHAVLRTAHTLAPVLTSLCAPAGLSLGRNRSLRTLGRTHNRLVFARQEPQGSRHV